MAFLPLKDDTPLRRIRFQYVTVALIAICGAVFLWQLSLAEAVAPVSYGLGTIPAVLVGGRQLNPELFIVPAALTLVTGMFLHGGWMHLLVNMLFLWIFGDNVEDAMGHLRFLAFYLLCGVAGGLAHVAGNPQSVAPVIGASGAIAGVLGAYLVLHPKARVLTLFMFYLVRLPAFVVLGGWIGFQFLQLSMESGGGVVAWWAHIGGFIAGMILVVPMRRKEIPVVNPVGRPKTAFIRRRSRIPDTEPKKR